MDKYKETLDYIYSRTGDFKPEVAIILGSGLGCFCDGIDGITIKYSEIPHFLNAGIKGHKGELLFCTIEGKKTIVMQGRFHFYEGNKLSETTYPIKIFKKLGVKYLFITNAAGATSLDYNVGDIMLISDHINFMGTNPLIGKNDDTLGERFPDMSNCYDKDLRKLALASAKELNIDIREGVYLATTGPSYETAAEIRMFKLLGANAVGMSTVPEAIVANYLKMNVIAFSTITNHATGVSNNTLSHEEVLKAGKITAQKLNLIIKKMFKELK